MTVYLDDQPIDAAGDDLQTVLTAAQQQLAGQGRVVVEIKLDGNVLNPAELSQQRHASLDHSDVHMVSAKPAELAAQALTHMTAQLDEATAAQNQAADLLQKDKTAEALQHVGRMVDIWQQTQQAVTQSIALVGLKLDSVMVDDVAASVITDQLVEALRQLRDLIKAGDTLALADALAYEWPTFVERWQKLINTLIAHIQN